MKSDGALTQAPSAWLGGSAVSAQGSSVELTASNPTGVIAGISTGTAPTDAFKYTSSNGISVTTVDGMVGVTANAVGPVAATPPAAAIELAGSSISQDLAGPITTTMGLKLTTGGPVTLTNTANNVAAIGTGGATGAFNFYASGRSKSA